MLRQTVYHGGMPFIIDISAIRRGLGGRIDWPNVPTSYTLYDIPVILTANAAQNATTLAVTALLNPISAGTVMDFGTNKFARATAAAVKGATSVTVAALPTALVTGDTAYVAPSNTLANIAQRKQLPAGTVMVRESGGNGLMIPRVAAANGETAYGLLYSNASEDDHSSSMTGYGVIVAGNIYENNLPDYSNAAWATIKAELNVTNGFQWENYADNRVAV